MRHRYVEICRASNETGLKTAVDAVLRATQHPVLNISLSHQGGLHFALILFEEMVTQQEFIMLGSGE